jgi:hypothetical protein
MTNTSASCDHGSRMGGKNNNKLTGIATKKEIKAAFLISCILTVEVSEWTKK